MNLWTYWQSFNGDTPPVICLCLESLKRHNPEIQILDDQTVEKLGGQELLEISKRWDVIKKADIIRLWLLKQFGGAWIDADFICLRTLPILSFLTAHSLVLRKCPDGITNSLVASRIGSQFIEKAYCAAKQVLLQADSLGYLDLGTALFTRLYKEGVSAQDTLILEQYPYESATWHNWKNHLLQTVTSPENNLHWHPEVIGYHVFGLANYTYHTWSREQLLGGDHFISHLLRQSLNT